MDNLYHSGRSTTKNRTLTYDYPVNISIKKGLEIPQNDLRKTKEKQTDEVLPFISTLIKIIYLYITQLRIPLKSLKEIIFQDLETSNL